MDNIAKGFCQCGCGRETTIIDSSCSKKGMVRGEPHKFVHGHNAKKKTRTNLLFEGYCMIFLPNHPRANKRTGYVFEHILVAEKVLGKSLPCHAVPHHVDENRSNNVNSNLVICENRAYHNLLHRRMRALKECGHASWRICIYCGKYDDPENMKIVDANFAAHHRVCRNKHRRDQYKQGKSR